MKENGLQTQKIDCFVAGWGYRQENKWTSLPDILQDAQVHLLYNETCEATYTDIDNNGEPVSIIYILYIIFFSFFNFFFLNKILFIFVRLQEFKIIFLLTS